MRTLVAAAVACSLVVGLSHAGDVQASMKRPVSIAGQELGSALKDFARERQLFLFFADKDLGGKKTSGVSGELTQDETLSKLLEGSGLTYRYIDEKTVSIVPVATQPPLKEDKSRRMRISQAAAPVESASASEESGGNELSEIVVTAQKRKENLRDVPISISVLSGSDMDRSTAQGVTEILNSVPGVTARTNELGGGTQIVMRGVGAGSSLFAGSSPIAYYLDSAPFGFIKQAIGPDPNAYDLQQMEVLRGPQGTLYGASAENGLVRVLTQDADVDEVEFKARTLVSATDGGGGNYRGDAAVNVPIVAGKLAVRAVVDYANLGGWIDGPVGNRLNDAELRNYRLKVNAQPTERLSIGLSGWITRNDYGAPAASAGDRRISAIIPEPISTDYEVYSAKVGYEFTHFTLTSATSYLDYINSGVVDLGIYNLPLDGFPTFSDFSSRTFSEELTLTSATGNAWKWTVGAFYRDSEDHTLQRLPGIFPAPKDFTDTSESYAFFGEIGRRFLNEQWEWTLGLRRFHDDVSSRENVQHEGLTGVPLYDRKASFNSTTPRAVLTWYPTADWTVYGSYSEGFRSGFPQAPDAPEFPSLRPDKLHNYELGAKTDLLNGRLSFDTSIYYIDWEDVQQSLIVPVASGVGKTALVNSESASGAGIDFAMTVRPATGLRLALTGSWNDLTMDEDVISAGISLFSKGDRLNLSSEFTGGVSGDYSFPLGESGFKAQFSASANYFSKQELHSLNGTSLLVNYGDDLLIARAALTVIAPTRWTTTLFADNLTNEYGKVTPPAFLSPELNTRERPRTIGLQVDFHY